jgi:hypothetical protein
MKSTTSLSPAYRTLIISVFCLATFLTYSFMNAAWTPAPANPPADNTLPPINTGAAITTIQPGQGSLQFDYLSARDTVIAGVEMITETVSTGVVNTDTMNVVNEVSAGEIRTDSFCTADGKRCATLKELLADKSSGGDSEPLTQNGSIAMRQLSYTSSSRTYGGTFYFPTPFLTTPVITGIPAMYTQCTVVMSATAEKVSVSMRKPDGSVCSFPQTLNFTASGFIAK